MLGLKLNHVSKKGPWCNSFTDVVQSYFIGDGASYHQTCDCIYASEATAMGVR